MSINLYMYWEVQIFGPISFPPSGPKPPLSAVGDRGPPPTDAFLLLYRAEAFLVSGPRSCWQLSPRPRRGTLELRRNHIRRRRTPSRPKSPVVAQRNPSRVRMKVATLAHVHAKRVKINSWPQPKTSWQYFSRQRSDKIWKGSHDDIVGGRTALPRHVVCLLVS